MVEPLQWAVANPRFFVQGQRGLAIIQQAYLQESLPLIFIALCDQVIPSTSREQLAEYRKHVWLVSEEPMSRLEQSENWTVAMMPDIATPTMTLMAPRVRAK
jgi:hypothetical protein